jgi:CheY-like chemotaxis protein
MGRAIPKTRVLVVDDSEIASEVMRVALEGTGYEVRATRSLGEFKTALDGWHPNVVLADVHMPGTTGPELCRWIKQCVCAGEVPVVLYSDMPEQSLEAIAVAAGADAFVSKEGGFDRISSKLTEVCEQKLH